MMIQLHSMLRYNAMNTTRLKTGDLRYVTKAKGLEYIRVSHIPVEMNVEYEYKLTV